MLCEYSLNDAPRLFNGDVYNATVFNMTEQPVKQVELGESYDLQGDGFQCVYKTVPQTAYVLFNFDCETGRLEIDSSAMLALKETEDTLVMLKIFLTDFNDIQPEETEYTITFLVAGDWVDPNLALAENEFVLALQKEAEEEVELRKTIKFVLMDVNDEGIARIVFSEPVRPIKNLTLIDSSVLEVRFQSQSDYPDSKLQWSWSVVQF